MKWLVTGLILVTVSRCFCCPSQNYTDESLLADNKPLRRLFHLYHLPASVTDVGFQDMLEQLEGRAADHHDEHEHNQLKEQGATKETDNHVHDHELTEHKADSSDVTENQLCHVLPKLLQDNLAPDDVITPLKFVHICPNILLQLLQSDCHTEEKRNDHLHSHTTEHSETTSRESWIGSFVSMATIGLISMGCIMIIPFLKKTRFYSAINHFLLSLAVGSLAGDALIHLIPHALTMNVGESDNIHLTHACYGFTAFMGILVFLVMERLHNLIGHKHSHGYPHSHENDSDDMVKEIGIISSEINQAKTLPPDDQVTVRFLPMSPIGSSFHDSATTAADRKNCFESCPTNNSENGDELATNGTASKCCKSKVNSHQSILPEAEKLMQKIDNNVQKKEELMANLQPNVTVAHPQKRLVRQDSKNFNMVLQEYHVGHHGHSHHGHSHVTGKKNSLRTMILLGDGMHTIMDGMAIGVAFGTSLTGGVATAIAVLCHELPHKLGDFAILFEMGMTVSQAIKMAIFLWLLSIMGSVIGVAVGSVQAVSPWIYCFTAGVFLYLALVDLLSEISINGGEMCTAGKQMALQLAGMLLGAAIMMIIAIYEHDLQSVLVDAF